MTKFEKTSSFSRRSVLLGGGALVVSIGAAVSLETVLGLQQAYAQGAKPPLTPDQLSSYIAVNADGSVSAFFGKMDMGHGLAVAIGQMVAEELDVAFAKVKVIMADTALTVNQGGASGSTGIQLGGKQLRMAAAEARRVLVEMAAGLLSTPAERLVVNDGVVSVSDDKSKRISYATMIGGKYFNVQLDWNKQYGNPLYAPGKAQPKKASEHRVVGQSIKRADVAPKVFCQENFCTDVKLPGMVHGRMIRPATAGSVPVKVDDSALKSIPGAKVVWDKGFLGVVADKEWDAIHFASESFIDEVAAAVGVDAIEFRLRYIKDPRDVAVIKAAAAKAKWDTRVSPRRDQTGSNVSGRGIAYAQRNGTRVAVIAEVDIDRSTGKIWARKFTVAHDCGQIINPDGLTKCIEGNIVQGVSRTLWEEVTFDRKSVTSVDWVSYPILDITETPAEVDVVLVNHPELPPTGAGEPSIRPVAAAIANAIFDATGVRIRRVPFSPERVKAALS